MPSLRARWKSLGLLTGTLAVIALGVATRSEPASALSCVTVSSRLKLISVTEDEAPGTGNYEGLVLLIGREPGEVVVSSGPQGEPAATWVESYRVATPSP